MPVSTTSQAAATKARAMSVLPLLGLILVIPVDKSPTMMARFPNTSGKIHGDDREYTAQVIHVFINPVLNNPMLHFGLVIAFPFGPL